MSQAISHDGRMNFYNSPINQRLREVGVFMLIAVAGLIFIALLSYSPNDPGWSYTGDWDYAQNAAGPVGAWLSDVFLYLFGILAYSIPLMLVGYAVRLFRDVKIEKNKHWQHFLPYVGFMGCFFSSSTLITMNVHSVGLLLPSGSGGILGDFFQNIIMSAFGWQGSSLLMMLVFLAGFTLYTGISWFALMDVLGGSVLSVFRFMKKGRLPTQLRFKYAYTRMRLWLQQVMQRLYPYYRKIHDQVTQATPPPVRKKRVKPKRVEPSLNRVVKVNTRAAKVEKSRRAEREKQMPLLEPDYQVEEGTLPPLMLLDPAKKSKNSYSEKALEDMSRLVEQKLKDFKIEALVIAVLPGPVVTLFELELAPGIKASKVTGLARDLARALKQVSVRVVEVIPGKTCIGIEVPNHTRETVFLSEILQSKLYEETNSVMTMALGKDISGMPAVADMAKMPHLLVAGTTGSGKSVAINTMILSLLYKATPKDVRMIMVDPKMLELSIYEGIPHLLTPVVTDMSEASNALRWCVAEMERRYKLMANMGVRNITGFNRKIKDAEKAGTPILDPFFVPNPLLDDPQTAPALEHLPYIVVVIDELADMMMVVGKKVEELIARLAQKARAAGIHLLLATQRPSVDVLTGLIKANIPSRIAFQVSSKIDSRTILDQMGAENLLGNGDMLYMPPGTAIPGRFHGAFVDDHEVHKVVDFLRKTGKTNYIDEILEDSNEEIPGISPDASDVEDTDPLYDQAVAIVTESRRGSISGVQRRLKIGYNRAARIIEEMERTGIVSPAEHNGTRTVLAPPPVEL